MSITRDFDETVRARAERDPKFREELLREAVDCLLSHDVTTAKIILCDFIDTARD